VAVPVHETVQRHLWRVSQVGRPGSSTATSGFGRPVDSRTGCSGRRSKRDVKVSAKRPSEARRRFVREIGPVLGDIGRPLACSRHRSTESVTFGCPERLRLERRQYGLGRITEMTFSPAQGTRVGDRLGSSLRCGVGHRRGGCSHPAAGRHRIADRNVISHIECDSRPRAPAPSPVIQVPARATAGTAATPPGQASCHRQGCRSVRSMDRDPAAWFLETAPASPSWSEGNLVRPLVHGATYFARLLEELTELEPGDRVWFTDWRGDADERLRAEGPSIGDLLARLALAW
jgi:hypothetical protein